MSKAATYIRSLVASWAGYGANIIVMLFLSPYVVHSLGDARFGLWSLLMSITGYLGLVEIGVRASTGRYVNYYLGSRQSHRVSAVINTSLIFYCLASVMVMVLAGGLGLSFGYLFPKIDPELSSQALWILLMMAVNVWMGLWGSTFGQLLMARDRFDLINVVQIVSLVARAVGTVLVLSWGAGLLALSGVLVFSSFVGLVGTVWSARRFGAPVIYSRRLASWACFREIFSYGAWSFLGNASTRAIFYASAAIIGVMLDATDVAYYSIGLILIDAGRDLVAFVCRVITPDIQKLAASSKAQTGRVMMMATNATMLIAVGLVGGLITLGPQFIREWMGPQYGRCGEVLVIISASQLGVMANFACNTSLNALGHVRLVALIFATEAALNLVLSVVLVWMGYGIVGVAWGTAVPAALCSGLVTMYFGCRRTGLSIRRYVMGTVGRWLPAFAIYLPICLLVHRWMDGDGWGRLALQILVCTLVYVPIGLLVLVPRGQLMAALNSRRSRMAMSASKQKGAIAPLERAET